MEKTVCMKKSGLHEKKVVDENVGWLKKVVGWCWNVFTRAYIKTRRANEKWTAKTPQSLFFFLFPHTLLR
jgi:hypothetical protein